MRPTIGRIVIVKGLPAKLTDFTGEHPAIITRVWTDTFVNVCVFRDNGQPETHTSVQLFEDRDAAEAWVEADSAAPYRTLAAFWPERV